MSLTNAPFMDGCEDGELRELKEENKQLEADLAKAMDAIIDTCDHCGWNGETCVNNECRFYEFYKDRKEKS